MLERTSPPNPLSLTGEGGQEQSTPPFLSSSFSPSPVKERGAGGEVLHCGITQSASVSAEKLNLARQMRQLPTAAEQRAWGLLRNRRCLGLKFRRQQVIRGLIVDFYCAEHRLVIELDGEIHVAQQDYDQARDAVFQAENIQVLRVENRRVDEKGYLEGILRELWEF